MGDREKGEEGSHSPRWQECVCLVCPWGEVDRGVSCFLGREAHSTYVVIYGSTRDYGMARWVWKNRGKPSSLAPS